ncbi:zinc finger, CCHC-type containing protein [Tanacetum coccineum]|uniref:Zinc finger, CCHC-type containing protein n=1 Tax=Tanacetum coccineum TaxID=301880 RepID=A0ABQ5DRF6_9ASTR
MLSRSSAEAEYRGVANVVTETCWLRNLLRELHTRLSSATLVYCDNMIIYWCGVLDDLDCMYEGIRRANCIIYPGWSCSDQEDIEGSTQQCTKSGVTKHMGVAVIQQQNGLVKENNMTLLAKLTRSPSSAIGFKTPIDMLGFFGWLASINQGMLEPVKVKCIFLGYRKGTGSVQVLQGVEVEVEPQEDHTFEVEPHGNVDHVEQHSAWELFSDREDSNEAAFAVAAVDKIYAHELLTFNNTVACEVISKWKARLKVDMDAWSDAEIWATKGLLDKAKGNVLGMEIVKDQSGNTLRVSQFMFYNEKLVQTLLERHFILSLEGSLSKDCDVKKNGDEDSRHIGFKVAMSSAFEISSSEVIIGRVPEKSDIVIPVATLSGTHARFLKKGGELFVMDLDSTNGDTNTAIFRVLKVRNVQPIAKSSDSESQVEVETEDLVEAKEESGNFQSSCAL